MQNYTIMAKSKTNKQKKKAVYNSKQKYQLAEIAINSNKKQHNFNIIEKIKHEKS